MTTTIATKAPTGCRWPAPAAEPIQLEVASVNGIEITDKGVAAMLDSYPAEAAISSRIYATFYREAQDRGLVS